LTLARLVGATNVVAVVALGAYIALLFVGLVLLSGSEGRLPTLVVLGLLTVVLGLGIAGLVSWRRTRSVALLAVFDGALLVLLAGSLPGAVTRMQLGDILAIAFGVVVATGFAAAILIAAGGRRKSRPDSGSYGP
jgi:hypothetical protein